MCGPRVPPEGDGYSLEPLAADPPGSKEPPPQDAGADAICLKCGYSLRGLDLGGRCPECGTPVERSMRGNLLRHSDEGYLASLHYGILVILCAVAAQVVVVVGALVAVVALGLSPFGSTIALDPVELGIFYADAAVSLVLLYGWWIFSSPDPAFVGVDRGVTARRAVRVAVVLRAALTAFTAANGTSFYLNPTGSISVAGMAAPFVEIAVWAFMFFVSMLYVQRLAPRLPDEHVARRARTLMWAGPVLYVFGCGIGTLIALVLYWNMLNWVRLDIKRIREAP